MPYKLVGQSAKISYGVTSQGRMTRKAPVRTEPHPTNPRLPRQRRYGLQIGRPIGKNFIRGHIARQDHPESPGSDGASPYQPALPRPRRYALQIGRPIGKNSYGVISQGRIRGKPRFGQSPPYLRPKPNYDFLTCSESCFSASSQSSSA